MMAPMILNRPSQLQPAHPRYLSALAQFPEPHQIASYLVVMEVANRGLDFEQELTCSVIDRKAVISTDITPADAEQRRPC
ncbi:hypothetical protein LZ554_009580 [Drepanopeziza brunnea f. sp. 'monogermtubi']|nr:hypothetical protein LZ554_009580 [Drepanopeziza brunnea f. sp. 'monogermtubi']